MSVTRMGPMAVLLCAAMLGAVTLGASAQSSTQHKFSLPPLPYNLSALEPITSNLTMFYHYGILNQMHVDKLNAALYAANSSALNNLTLTEIIQQIGQPAASLDLTTAQQNNIRNQAGGAWNHAFFWKVMAPYGSPQTALPNNSSNLTQAVVRDFGSWNNLITKVDTVGANLFGSGFTWLVCAPNGTLTVLGLPNQNNPLTNGAGIPLMAIDLWEHSYYLDYGPGKAAFLATFWNIVNWQQVQANYMTAMQGNSSANLAALIGDAANMRTGMPSMSSGSPSMNMSSGSSGSPSMSM